LESLLQNMFLFLEHFFRFQNSFSKMLLDFFRDFFLNVFFIMELLFWNFIFEHKILFQICLFRMYTFAL